MSWTLPHGHPSRRRDSNVSAGAVTVAYEPPGKVIDELEQAPSPQGLLDELLDVQNEQGFQPDDDEPPTDDSEDETDEE